MQRKQRIEQPGGKEDEHADAEGQRQQDGEKILDGGECLLFLAFHHLVGGPEQRAIAQAKRIDQRGQSAIKARRSHDRPWLHPSIQFTGAR